MKKRNQRDQPAIRWQDVLLHVLRGSVLALAIALALLLLSALAISQGHLSQDKMEGVVLASCVLASLLGTLYVLSSYSKNSLLLGVSTGLLLFFLLLILGALSHQRLNPSPEILFACLSGAVAAKFLPSKKKKKY